MHTPRTRSVTALVLVASAATCGAEITNFRTWLDSNPALTNSMENIWYSTVGMSGGLIAENVTEWRHFGADPANTPLIARKTEIGEYADGSDAGGVTFRGSLVHPGRSLDVVLVFAPTESVTATAMAIRSELVGEAMRGNGIDITVWSTIDGVTSNLGTVVLSKTSDARLDLFDLGGPVTLDQGDTISIAFGNNGSYYWDQVNFNAFTVNAIPGPGVGVIAAAGLIACGRRRR